jgi:pilus assembly protein CpaB
MQAHPARAAGPMKLTNSAAAFNYALMFQCCYAGFRVVRIQSAAKMKRMKPARLIILVIAIASGGIAAYLAGRAPELPPPPPVAKLDTADVLVAAADIRIGTKLSAQDLRWQTWPASVVNGAFVLKDQHPGAIAELAGSTVRRTFSAGEPIVESKLVKSNGSGYMAAILPQGMRAASVEISPETGAGGFILPNDQVDVILSRRDKRAEKLTSIETIKGEIIFSNVPVLAIDQTVEEKGGQRTVVGKTATLELTPKQAAELAVARQMGTISLALRSLLDSNEKEAPSTYSMRIYRGATLETQTCNPICR